MTADATAPGKAAGHDAAARGHDEDPSMPPPAGVDGAPPDDAPEAHRLGELASRVEAALFVAAEPLSLERLAQSCGAGRPQVRRALAELAAHLDAHGHATALTELAGGFQLLTRPQYADVVAGGAARMPPLSRAAMETLAIIAFWQPATRAAVDELRGVHSEGAIATLLERGLITDSGRAEAPGRPYLYVTTGRFLEHFGLRSLDDLAATDGMPPVPRPDGTPPAPRQRRLAPPAPDGAGVAPDAADPRPEPPG